jgi:hypothetical protein
LFDDLGDIDHVVFTAGEPLALTDMAALNLDKAREFLRAALLRRPVGRPRRHTAPAGRRLDHLDHRHRRPPA